MSEFYVPFVLFAVVMAVMIVYLFFPAICYKWQKRQVTRQIARIRREAKRPVISRVEGPPPRTGSDAISMYRKMGYDRFADHLEKAALPCIALVPAKPESGSHRGKSRLGGLPDLTEPELWPERDGKSLSFVAQVNLEEIPDGTDTGLLPREGILLFFYDTEQEAWGFDPKDDGSWRVIFRERVPEAPPEIEFPRDLPVGARYKEVSVNLESQISIPEPCDIFPEHGLSDEQKAEIAEVYSRMVEERVPRHQLLGHPAAIQSPDMRLECQVASHGIYCGDPSGFEGRQARDLASGDTDWKLLLQVDSDKDAEMMWGDCGRLYFWIREQDLKEREFGKVWMILQCY